MVLRLRELEVLRAVMETGSTTAAARTLHVTQPAISKMLLQVEQHLGFDCFVRQQGRLVPTKEGRALFPEIVKALSGIDLVSRFAKDLRTSRTGTVTMASVPSIAVSLLPAAIQAFRQDRPDVRVSLTTTTNYEVTRLVVENRVDFGLVLLPAGEHEVAFRDLCSARLVCVMPGDHELASRAKVGPHDIARFPLISLGREQPVRVLAERAFARAGATYPVAVEVTQSATALALIRAGAGIAVMDGFTLRNGGHEGLVSRPVDPKTDVTCRLFWSRSDQLSRLSSAFLEQVDGQAARSFGGAPASGPAALARPPRRTTR